MLDKNWITVVEAAEIVGCSPQRIRELALDNKIKASKLTGKCWVVDRKEVEKMAKNPSKTGRPRKSVKNT